MTRHLLFLLISRVIEKEEALLHFISIVVKFKSIIVILSLNEINSCFHLIFVIIFIFDIRKSKKNYPSLQHPPSISTCSLLDYSRLSDKDSLLLSSNFSSFHTERLLSYQFNLVAANTIWMTTVRQKKIV